MNDTSLITFKAISTFVNELAESFGDEHRPLKLYAHLLNKTTLSHTKAIKKHIEAFTGFCVGNRECIMEKKAEWKVPRIEYNQRVYIDMLSIFQLIGKDKDTSRVVWTHILTLSALVDPTGQAKQILKEQAASHSGEGDEAEFLTDIISKVESSVDPNANPMEAVNSIMQSGVFTELVSGMGNGLQDGSLDLNKLMGTVQNMVTKLNDQVPEGQGDQTVDMINTMMGSINAGANAPDGDGTPQVPDISAMLGPMMGAMMNGQGQGGVPDMSGLLGAQQTQSPSDTRSAIEQQIDAQVAAAKESGKLKAEGTKDGNGSK